MSDKKKKNSWNDLWVGWSILWIVTVVIGIAAYLTGNQELSRSFQGERWFSILVVFISFIGWLISKIWPYALAGVFFIVIYWLLKDLIKDAVKEAIIEAREEIKDLEDMSNKFYFQIRYHFQKCRVRS